MKSLKITVVLKDDKVATGIKTEGFLKNNILDEFAILGILENLVCLQKNKLNTLIDIQK